MLGITNTRIITKADLVVDKGSVVLPKMHKHKLSAGELVRQVVCHLKVDPFDQVPEREV